MSSIQEFATPHAIPLDNPVEHTSQPGFFLSGVFGENPYFQAGFGLMGLGVGLTVLRQGFVLGTTALRRRMLVSLEISNKDRSYEWFLAWMSHQNQLAQYNARVPWVRSHQLSVETIVEQRENGSSSALFNLVAGPGTHYFKYRGAWMQMKRERETRSMQLMSGVPWETVTLTALTRDRSLFPHLLTEARDLAVRGNEGKLVIHTAWGIEWKPFGQPRRKRPLRSVVLEPGVSDRIETDIKAFLDRRQWYADRGNYQSSITFSGFLNALDGVASGEERIIFMTTNHIERLDPALIRPGRVDLAHLIDDASPAQAQLLFNRFYGGSLKVTGLSDDIIQAMGIKLHDMVSEELKTGRRVSMAALQGHFIRHEAKDALDKCRDLFTR
ncbi:Complex III assembly protein translocase and chaperone [Leucoagaricus gongylophorus]